MNNEIAIRDSNQMMTRDEGTAKMVALATAGLTSDHSKRAYERSIIDFLEWVESVGRPGLSKATVNRYRAHLINKGLSPATINRALSAIRRLASEGADNNMFDPMDAAAIGRVKGVKQAGRRTGNWLDKSAAQRLLELPDASSLKGLRDRAILAVMLGTGLRRSEVAELTFEHIQQRDGRWVVLDMVGKGGRVRTVPMPSWGKHAIDLWAQASGRSSGRVFVSVNKGGRCSSEAMTPQAIYNVVRQYASEKDEKTAAHDLRRTFAKLAHKGGAALEQIQITLGHSSIQTTERYLGVEQDLSNAPCDVLGLSI